jgi:molecular chaperone GrpE
MSDQDGAEAVNPVDAESLEAQIETLRSELEATKDQALRALADAENTRRRAEREANDARAYAIQKFARDLLDAADNLSRAVQHAPQNSSDPQVKNLVLGVEMTEKALQAAFERNGLKRVEPERGAKFDPNLHQAMMEQADDGLAPGSVVMMAQPGYELYGRIVRPAMVAVTPKAQLSREAKDAYPSGDATPAGVSLDEKA